MGLEGDVEEEGDAEEVPCTELRDRHSVGRGRDLWFLALCTCPQSGAPRKDPTYRGGPGELRRWEIAHRVGCGGLWLTG